MFSCIFFLDNLRLASTRRNIPCIKELKKVKKAEAQALHKGIAAAVLNTSGASASNKIIGGHMSKRKSFICLEGKSMIPHHQGNTFLFCFSQQLPHLGQDHWKADMALFKGPQPRLLRCLRTYRDTGKLLGLSRQARRTQDTIANLDYALLKRFWFTFACV